LAAFFTTDLLATSRAGFATGRRFGAGLAGAFLAIFLTGVFAIGFFAISQPSPRE